MKSKSHLRILTLLLASLMLLAALAGCSPSSSTPPADGSSSPPPTDATQNPETTPPTDENPYAEPMTISWLIPTQQDNTVAETPFMQAVMEKFNVSFDLTEITPADDQYNTRVSMSITSKQIPDIMSRVQLTDANVYGGEGAFAEITQYLAQLPELKARLDSITEEAASLYNSDGKLYSFPVYVLRPGAPSMGFSYSKAAVEAVYSGPLKTTDDYYSMLTAMKAAYPDSYPLSVRVGGGNLRHMFTQAFTQGNSNRWNPWYPSWNYTENQFTVALASPEMKACMEYLAKLYAEGLIDPEFMTDEISQLLAKVKDDKVFSTIDWVGGLAGADQNFAEADGKLYPLETPGYGGTQIIEAGSQKLGTDVTVISSALEGAKLERVLAILDFMYSEEAYDLLYWHPDVTTGEGTQEYIDVMYDLSNPERDSYIQKYLPWSLAAGGFIVDSTNMAVPGTGWGDFQIEVLKPENAHRYYPSKSVVFTPEEIERDKELQSGELMDVFNSTIDLFITGQKSMSEWDAFVTQIMGLGSQDLCDLYNTALARG